MNAKLFINYRREDTAPYAGRLYDRLTAHFSEGQVFMDIDQIDPGEDFVEVINRKVGSCDIAIVMIGRRWLSAGDLSGKRRLDDEEDFVRMEIVAALERKIRVIPVLVDGARMPGRQDLPEALAPLSRRNAIELSDTRFHADTNRLIEAIKRSLAASEQKPELSTTSAAQPSEPVAKDIAEPSESKPAEPEAPKKVEVDAISADAPVSLGETTPSKESAVWKRKRLIMFAASGAIGMLLLAVTTVLLMRPHPTVAPSKEDDYAEGNKLAFGLRGTKIDLPKAVEYFQRAAAKNAPEAEARLASWTNNGVGGLAKDNVKAGEWAKKALADGLIARATNSVDGQMELAGLYRAGLGVPKDETKAAELVQKAAGQGYAIAQNFLGLCYQKGWGVTIDFHKAAELYQGAADQGLAAAQVDLGGLYQNGWGVTKDLRKAAELYQKAADQGSPTAQDNLAELYYTGQGVPKDLEKAAELYQKAADQGSQAAIFHLKSHTKVASSPIVTPTPSSAIANPATLSTPAEAQLDDQVNADTNFLRYEYGELEPKDLGKAVEFYQKETKIFGRNAKARNNLGLFYKNGWGVTKDLGKAVELWQTADAQGDPLAQINLGLLYEYGEGVPKDLEKAAEVYQKAADQGNAVAQFKLGRLYQHGYGVPKDLEKAADLYQKAADQGNAYAQNELGWLYEYGDGVPEDFKKARELYQKAADQGDASGQYHLARIYKYGLGVPKDLAKARELYQKAASQGDKAAINEIDHWQN